MENQIQADKAGTVSEVKVAAGDTVGAGDVRRRHRRLKPVLGAWCSTRPSSPSPRRCCTPAGTCAPSAALIASSRCGGQLPSWPASPASPASPGPRDARPAGGGVVLRRPGHGDRTSPHPPAFPLAAAYDHGDLLRRLSDRPRQRRHVGRAGRHPAAGRPPPCALAVLGAADRRRRNGRAPGRRRPAYPCCLPSASVSRSDRVTRVNDSHARPFLAHLPASPDAFADRPRPRPRSAVTSYAIAPDRGVQRRLVASLHID